jgi:tetratricopeptide (TPR) repeat protein
LSFASAVLELAMSATFRLIFAAACLSFCIGARAIAQNATNTIPALPSSDATIQSLVNGYIQIQAQLHDTQAALEKSSEDAQRNATETAQQIQELEKTIASEQASQLEMANKNQQSTLMMAGAFGLTVLAAVLFMVYLQWRAVSRMGEMAAPRPAGLLAGGPRTSLVSDASIANANARLFGVVDHLQKRILELEQGARVALPDKKSPSNNGPKNEATIDVGSKPNGKTDRVAELLADGQTLLNANQPERALRLFDEALAMNPVSAEAMIKKGGALEKLERFNEAVACYDNAIAADGSATIAYLQKGGLYNRLARYDEALKCYEQALQAQEKKAATAVN